MSRWKLRRRAGYTHWVRDLDNVARHYAIVYSDGKWVIYKYDQKDAVKEGDAASAVKGKAMVDAWDKSRG